MQSGFLSLPLFELEFGKNSEFFLYRAALWPSCRKPPIDGVLSLVECNNAPIDPDKQEGFENWQRTTGSLF